VQLAALYRPHAWTLALLSSGGVPRAAAPVAKAPTKAANFVALAPARGRDKPSRAMEIFANCARSGP